MTATPLRARIDQDLVVLTGSATTEERDAVVAALSLKLATPVANTTPRLTPSDAYQPPRAWTNPGHVRPPCR
ncbi:hypothetical protein [Streptomyces sp. NPDC050738]|uniref:hypothetical protein n=1 Tax=Streptomyces sp. NPDC050738 TaxID=3154744 RepID=UPI0034360607